MTIDNPRNVEELAKALQEPLLPQEPVHEDEDCANRDNTVIDNDINFIIDGSEGHENGQATGILYDGLNLKDSLLIKSLYFLDALGSSAWGRFSAIYYNNHSLNTQQIGLIEGLRTFTPTISMVFWGFVTDHFRCRKQVWILTKSGSTAILLLLALPYVTKSFFRILWVSVGAQLFASNGAILDSYTLELLGTENKLFYGRYRLYASLSWGLGSIVMGWITDHYGFDWNFIMFGALSILMIVLVAYFLPDNINKSAQQEPTTADYRTNEETNVEDEAATNDTAEDYELGDISELLSLVIKPRVLFFFVEVIVMGAAMATVERLLFLYMVNDLHASTLLCGLSVGVNVLFELPIFWYASSILNYLGADGMFLLSMTCFIVRVYGYTLLTPSTKCWILALESMHGVTFATFWIVTTDVSKRLIDKSKGGFWSTTIPSVVQMLYNAVGATIGSVLGGFAMHQFGSREMYLFTAELVLCMLVVHLIGSILVRTCYLGLRSVLPECHHQIANEINEEEDNEQDHEQGNDEVANSRRS
uniref:Major facilitator superfamily associated domain-containing protein n=1 Tax=Pseudo-nitzschia australis TaxID=44445 RepID=A0A7S4AX16_9STRA|mmetsp:Transcript_27561/g.60666  ORF Transcript_27561/g.60666 Transcript_27561/m.60666 type:complete len:532 (-) Transcript_27561:338-1933(-)